ncbi:hypothetical protein F8S09_15275 [Deinococcus sp. SDU3-2]|uniref:BIG2 domain-containing protein n=1 Tax=Deinococcus terrestris TaxID=2651870 RepID=A0A7X1TT04_9DEIO|nr:hypothetical protein [Deinococcus terrestris]MPY68019.1 hypothetical protein [Deinococcus terrestris]
MLTSLWTLALAASPHAAPPPPSVCPSIFISPVTVTVKNERGLVLGTAATGSGASRSPSNTLKVSFQKGADGRYTVTASKRWYRPTTVRNVRVQESRCGPVNPPHLTLTLRPRPDAPLIRDFQIRSTRGDGSGSWPAWTSYRVFLDAPASVGRAVTWHSSRPEVATIDRLGVLRTKCLKTLQTTVITATLKADPTQKATARYSTGSARIDCRKARGQ